MFISARESEPPLRATPTAAPPLEPELSADIAWRALEEVDYGLILASRGGHVQHANHLARHELSRSTFLRVEHEVLTGASAEQTADIMRGIQYAARGRRQMLNLRHGDDTLPVACIPLFQPFEGEANSVLLMLARQPGAQNLAVTFFSRSHGLTPAEEQVLRALCDGQDVREIATAQGVTQSVVRTQVRALRDKTSASSIRRLVQKAASMPPMVPAWLPTPARAPAHAFP